MILKKLLALAAQGRPSHSDYIPSLLNDLANLPVSEYLAQYPDELERLSQIMNYPKVYMSGLTYQDVAFRILVMVEQKLPIGGEGMDILAKPFLDFISAQRYRGAVTMLETLTLAEKLKQNRNPTILVAQLLTSDYFDTIGEMLNDPDHYERVFFDIPVYGEGSIAQSLCEAAQIPDKYKVFFRVLILPFTAMKGVHYYDARYHYR